MNNKPRQPTKKEAKQMLNASEEKHKFINQNTKQMLAPQEKKEMLKESRKLAKFFKIEVTISIFGHVIINWVYPPQKEENNLRNE